MTVLLHPRHHAHCTENMLIGAMGTETWGYLISQGALGLAEMTERLRQSVTGASPQQPCSGHPTDRGAPWERQTEREREKEKESRPLSCDSCCKAHIIKWYNVTVSLSCNSVNEKTLQDWCQKLRDWERETNRTLPIIHHCLTSSLSSLHRLAVFVCATQNSLWHLLCEDYSLARSLV